MLKIFNTQNRKKEIFIPCKNKEIHIYVCGVTVYDFCHIGHGRTFVIYDNIIRYLRYLGYNVIYIRNITDIDDKIILKSFKNNIPIKVFTKKMILQMKIDFSFLNILSPTYEPIVTNYIHQIIKMIQVLLYKKYAYISNNGYDVLYSLKKDINYGLLSNKKCNYFNKIYLNFNNYKKNISDFFLWKKSKINEIGWLSPWGFGRPGWHIECSALNTLFFKNYIDIHGGGNDLIFPHHENELSQLSCYNNKYIIKYWIHSGMIILNNKKMSKSLGNFILLKKIFKKYHGETLRYFFLSTNYRKPIFYYEKNLNKSFFLLKRLYLALFLNLKKKKNIKKISISSVYLNKFKNFMNDDFNTPEVLKVLTIISKKINFLYKNNYIIQSNILSSTLLKLGNLIGILYDSLKNFLNKNIFKKKYPYIKFLIHKRNKARKNKNWIESDFLRKKLFSMGVVIEDTLNNSNWYFKNIID